MIKKFAILFVMFAVVMMGFTITGATTASYQWVARLVNASNFVVNFTASATAASYQHTCNVVDQTGTVMNPGTASATSANPDCTIRIVDSNGFVQSALGGGANPTGPQFVARTLPSPVAVSTTSISVALPAAYSTPGNATVIGVCANDTGTSSTVSCPAGWTRTQQGGTTGSGTAAGALCSRCFQAGDPSSVTVSWTQNVAAYGLAVPAVYSNAVCPGSGSSLLVDASANASSSVGSTGAQSGAVTTTQPNDLLISLVCGAKFASTATYSTLNQGTERAQVNNTGDLHGPTIWMGDFLVASPTANVSQSETASASVVYWGPAMAIFGLH